MRVGSHPEAGTPAGVAQGTAPAAPRREFSGVLKDNKDQPNSALREDLNPDSTGTGKAPGPARASIPCVEGEKTSAGSGGDGQGQPSAAEADQTKVESHPESSRPAVVDQSAASAIPRAKYSEVHKDRKDRRDSASSEDLDGNSTLLNVAPPELAAVTPPAPAHVGQVDTGKAAAPISEALVASLVREITVQIPPSGAKSVDIQFGSRTLQGLHVRIQNAGGGLNVQFSTSSEAISRLLTSNTHALTDALQQRGYVSPVITVQRTEGSLAYSGGDSRQSSRDRSGRNGNEQGSGGQKRR
jgi:flagellar hook-length control protein FliK